MNRLHSLSQYKKKSFRKVIYDYYKNHGRRLPWRSKKTTTYNIFVSEVMLQQTQVDRVITKYKEFIAAFKNFNQLANAPFSDVIKKWQGMGYNRRALFLHKCAKKVVNDYGGRLPRDPDVLQTLPGIGKATAASICAFGFNRPTIYLDTNVRSVFIYHFFSTRPYVTDDELIPVIQKTLDTTNPHKWYSALMDYGVHIKKQYGNPSRRSKHYTKQARFEGSNRQIRGAIIKLLNTHRALNQTQIEKRVGKGKGRIKKIIQALHKEGFIKKKKGKIFIA